LPGMNLSLESLPSDLAYAAVLTVYVLAIVFGSKPLYDYMISRGAPRNVAVYYIRKVIHVFAGGVVALATPYVFGSPVIPLLMGLAMAVFLVAARKLSPLYWFQVEENAYEVNFTVAWGASISLLWIATGDPKLAIIPAVFISFGDAVTGVVRNALFKRRTKHWAGNVAMLAVTLPLGYALAGSLGVVAAVVASFIERYEFGPIDDNVLITVASTAIILAWSILVS